MALVVNGMKSFPTEYKKSAQFIHFINGNDTGTP